MTVRHRRFAVAFLAFLVLAAVLATADPPSVVGRLNLAEGAVSFRPGSLDEWAPAVLNYPLTSGDHIWADAGSRAELHVGSTAVRLDGETEISFLNLDEDVVQVGVSEGRVNVRLRRLDPGDAFEIDTPNSVFTILEPGSYSISVQGDEGSSLTVWKGRAEAAAAGNDFMVPAGQTANVSGSGSVAYYTQPAGFPGGWDSWCAARDSREEQFTSTRYVPREMIGIEDLDENGSWVVMAGYGPVWAPARVVPGWAPYKFGHWVWVAPWGWTWIDDAPWGFAPFHYGRWVFAGARWVWIPGEVVARPVYAPALVVFIGGGPGDPSDEGIGWFPLGPREVYVPPYAASTTYVQRINVTTVFGITIQTIETINVTQVTYVNRSAPAAVTVVPRQSFMYGHPTSGRTIVYSNEQVRRAPILGMGATIVPQRESIVGQPFVARNPPSQPPPQVAGRSVYGRLQPAPAPAPFTFRSEPMQPATVYQRPPQQLQPRAPVRQQAPMVINPNRAPGFQTPPRGTPQPQPMQPQPMQPQQAPRAPVMQAPPQRQPAPVMQAPPQRQPAPVMQAPPQRQPAPVMQAPPQRQPAPVMQAPPQRQPAPVMQAPPQRQPAPVMQAPPQRQPAPVMQAPPQRQPAPVMQAPPQQQPPQQQPPQQQPPQQQPPQQGDRNGGDNRNNRDNNGGQSDNQGRGEARSLLNALKLKNLPEVQGHLESARKLPGTKLDFAALSRQLDSARSAIAAAESTLSSGKPDTALQQAQAVQRQLADLDRQISDATRSSRGGDSDDQGQSSGRQGDGLGGKH